MQHNILWTQSNEMREIPPIFLKLMQRKSVNEFVTKSLWQTWRQLAVFAVLLWMQQAHKAVHSHRLVHGEPKVTWDTFIELRLKRLSKYLCGINMMPSLNGNVFYISGCLWRDFTGHFWITLTKDQWCTASLFLLLLTWTSGWAKSLVPIGMGCNLMPQLWWN